MEIHQIHRDWPWEIKATGANLMRLQCRKKAATASGSQKEENNSLMESTRGH